LFFPERMCQVASTGIARASGSRKCWGQEVDLLKIILHNGGH
jgi:hypothetical protein